MNTQTVNKIDELINTAKHIAVVFPGNPDLDVAAASLGLYLSLTKIGKSVSIISPTPVTVAFGNLVGINKVRLAMDGGTSGGLIISLPYQQGSIEKISYDIVGDRINLTVVPGAQGLNFTTDDISYQSQSLGQADLLFAVGISQEEDLLSIAPEASQAEIVTIDNNPANSQYGSLLLVDIASSSLSEIVTNLLITLNLPLDIDIAQNLLSGIVEKTDNFQNENTSPSAFEAAAVLIQKGAVRQITAKSYQKPSFPFAQDQGQRRGGKGVYGQQVGSALNNPVGRSDTRSQLRGPNDKVSRMPFPVKGGQDRFPDGPKPQNTQRVMPQDTAKGQNGAKGQPAAAPKDWFEPKIYSGKTPVS